MALSDWEFTEQEDADMADLVQAAMGGKPSAILDPILQAAKDNKDGLSPVALAARMASELAKEGCHTWLKRFITQDPDMEDMKGDVIELVDLQEPVLINGATGTGKELIAHALHGDREGAFLPLNCAAMPEHLIESELFGHIKGAFTDAREENMGIFRSARDGTVFLDEISELSLPLQAKLLRAIQSQEVRPVGSARMEKINCRFIAATNSDLRELVEAKKFRLDLYARLSIFELYLKPLKDRPGDIVPILKSMGSKIESIDEIPKWYMEEIYLMNVRALYKYHMRVITFGKLWLRLPETDKSSTETADTSPGI